MECDSAEPRGKHPAVNRKKKVRFLSAPFKNICQPQKIKEVTSMQVPGYVGICAHCFWPILEGELHQFRTGGSNFHKKCAATENTYYIRREKRIAAKIAKSEGESNA
jgi:hypothetical protein